MRLCGLLLVSQVWAAPSGAVEGHPAAVTQLIFPLINFLIFLYLVKRFVVPLIKDHLRSRRAEIQAAVNEAGEGKRRAEGMVREYKGRRARSDEEAEKIRETARSEAERERSRLLLEAEDAAKKIKADADFLAQQELKVARQQVRKEIARLAQAAAEKMVERHVTPADQERIVEEFLQEAGGVR